MIHTYESLFYDLEKISMPSLETVELVNCIWCLWFTKSGLVSSNAWMRNKDGSLLSFLKSSFFSQVREDNGDYIQFHIHFILDSMEPIGSMML